MDKISRLIAHGLAVLFSITSSAQILTVQVGSPPAPPAALVRHDDIWSFHKGTNAPQANWQTIADATLNADWGGAAGGFGYGDNAITNIPGTSYESTMLPDMLNGYTTLFIRRTFTVGSQVDTNLHLLLTMDFDDGFVAYLDGVEIRRANTTNAIGSAVTFAQTTGANSHEASCCTSPNPATTYDLGAVSNRLAVGTHVLAIVGLNQSATSTDFHLIADLLLSSAPGGSAANNGCYVLTSTNTVFLTGTNTVAGSTRVTVNGDDSVLNPAQGAWTNSVVLMPGFNRLFIAALDNAGNLLSNLTQDIVYEPVAISVSGALAGSVSWTNSNEVIHVVGNVTVPSGAALTIGPGVVVIMSPGASILAGPGALIDLQGLETREVYFLPATSDVWNEIAADGAGSTLTIRHADISRGAVKFRNGALGLLEDSYLHEYKNGTVPIAGCTSAAEVTVRRSHFNVYHETLWQLTRMTVEASLFENANNTNSDALDFDTAPPGSVIRRSTFRFGPQQNTDAIDIGSSSFGTLIEGCLMHDFPNDKGVSIGETSYAITIRNCLMYRNDSGVAVKDGCTAMIEGSTIANNGFGFRNCNKANPGSPTGGGHITNSSNNILWGNVVSISLSNASTVVANYSDFGGTNWTGTGNISVDPLFVNAAAGDYRLQSGSPALGAGVGGANLGVTLPVGGIPMWVSNLAAISSIGNDVALSWIETADNETGFRIERSFDKVVWQIIGGTAANVTSFADTTGLAGVKYYYRVRATNDLGVSPLSNLASGQRQAINIVNGGNVGGTVSQNTCWAEGGTFTVTSSVTVANGATLFIKPGAIVQFNSGLNLTVANGGALFAEGSSNAPIRFTRNGAVTWGHLVVNGAVGSPETRISNARFEFNNRNGRSSASKNRGHPERSAAWAKAGRRGVEGSREFSRFV